MKKLIALVLALVCALGLVACYKQGNRVKSLWRIYGMAGID